jgi:hypothetical protein
LKQLIVDLIDLGIFQLTPNVDVKFEVNLL